MKLSALIAPLITAKAPHDQIMAVIQAYEQQQENALEARRKADADRQARKRERDMSRDVTLRHSDSHLVRERDARVDVNTKPIDNNNSKNNSSKDVSEFRDALASLGSDRLDALIKVRKAKKAPINGYAAKLLSKAADNCKLSITEAADMCIERNWLTVKPDWIAKPTARGSPQNGSPRNLAEASTQLLAQMREAENANTQPKPSPDLLEQDVRHLAIANGERRS